MPPQSFTAKTTTTTVTNTAVATPSTPVESNRLVYDSKSGYLNPGKGMVLVIVDVGKIGTIHYTVPPKEVPNFNPVDIYDYPKGKNSKQITEFLDRIDQKAYAWDDPPPMYTNQSRIIFINRK